MTLVARVLVLGGMLLCASELEGADISIKSSIIEIPLKEFSNSENDIVSFPALELQNNGDRDVELIKLVADCACVGLAFDSNVIKSGEKKVIKVTVPKSGPQGVSNHALGVLWKTIGQNKEDSAASQIVVERPSVMKWKVKQIDSSEKQAIASIENVSSLSWSKVDAFKAGVDVWTERESSCDTMIFAKLQPSAGKDFSSWAVKITIFFQGGLFLTAKGNIFSSGS